MAILKQAQLHRVFPAELLGDTLIISPTGDAVGFGLNQVSIESSTLQDYARSGAAKHLIIDLSRANYFGSIVLGELIKIGSILKQSGGRIVLAGASNDMLDVLRIMKLDVMWELFDSRPQAIARVAHLSLLEQLAPYRKVALALLAIAAVWVLYQMVPRYDHEGQYLEELTLLESRAEELRRVRASELEWERFLKGARERLDLMVPRLEKLASSDNEVARNLLWAARDYAFEGWRQRNQPKAESAMLQYQLELVRFMRTPERERGPAPISPNEPGNLLPKVIPAHAVPPTPPASVPPNGPTPQQSPADPGSAAPAPTSPPAATPAQPAPATTAPVTPAAPSTPPAPPPAAPPATPAVTPSAQTTP